MKTVFLLGAILALAGCGGAGNSPIVGADLDGRYAVSWNPPAGSAVADLTFVDGVATGTVDHPVYGHASTAATLYLDEPGHYRLMVTFDSPPQFVEFDIVNLRPSGENIVGSINDQNYRTITFTPTP